MSLQKVIIHCQYVYGLGHLVRALHIAKGLTKHFEVYFLNGGEFVQNYDVDESIQFIQLPAIYKNEDSSELTSVSDDYSLSECFELRNQMIFKVVQLVKPDVVITEHFPFGLFFEKEATRLIEYAKKVNSDSKIVCSVRDVIESAKGSGHDQRTIGILNELYHLILIHGQEKLIPIELSFPLANRIETKIIYTGYVVDPVLGNKETRSNTILVSVAGGRVGRELLESVIEAFELVKTKTKHNLVIFNGAFNDDFETASKDPRIRYFNFNRGNFLNQLSQSDVSISLGGYNSTMESLYAGNKVLIYNRKFLGSNEEQNIRISTLKNLGLVDVISLKELSVETLSKKLIVQFNKENRGTKNSKVDFAGVENTVYQIRQLIERR